MRLSDLTLEELEPIARARIAQVKRTDPKDWSDLKSRAAYMAALQGTEEVEWEYCRRYQYPLWFKIYASVKIDG